jgi:PAS domain S-box-containing protein
MKIATKILITTLPLVVLGLLGLGWMTTSLSERALNQLAQKWLSAKLLEAIKIAENDVALLRRYDLEDIPGNVKKAQDAAAEAMHSIQIGQSGCILVVNASGSIISSSDQSKIGTDASSAPWFKTTEDKKKGYRNLIYKGVTYLTVRQYFEPWQWHVLACARQREVYGEVDYMRGYVFAAAGLIAVVMTIVLVVLIHRITAPLHILVRKVRRIGQGDLEADICLASSDEIGILADAFNSSAVQLSELIGSLEHQIAERKRAEARLRVSEERFRSIFENAVEGIFQATPGATGRFISANPAHARIMGFDSPEQMMAEVTEIGPRLWIDPQDRKSFCELVAKGALTDFEVQLRRRDGRLIWVSFNARPVLDATGKLDYIEGIMLDITDRKQAEKKLNEHRQILEELVLERTLEMETAKNKAQQYLDIAGVILVAIDANRRVTLINQKGCEVLGGAADEIIGKDWFERFVPENNRQDLLEGFQRLMAGELETVEFVESPVLMQNGRERLIAWHHVVLRNSEKKIVGTLSSGADITEKKYAEKQIIRLNQDLQQRAAALEAANKELEGFTYSVSHDLRAPLRHIDGFIEMLKAKDPPDEQSRHYMANISDAAQKMGRLIDGQLSFIRMGRYAMSIHPVELSPLVHDVIRELEPDNAGRNIDWRIGDLPVVRGNAAMLRTVLVNLISNALKFTRPRQQAEIEIGSLPGQDSEAVLFVRDNGVGFDMTYADKLFGVFQRLHRADEFEGTGIGLANVHRIIARQGGRTWATGELNQGATFFFALPRPLQGEEDWYN